MTIYKQNYIFAISLIISCLSVAGSFIAEYVFLRSPCNLCLWQRYFYLVIFSLSIVGIFIEKKTAILWLVIASYTGMFCLSLYHALIQHGIVSDPCIIQKVSNVAEFWKMINKPPPCSQITVSIFGIPFSALNAIMSAVFNCYSFKCLMNKKN